MTEDTFTPEDPFADYGRLGAVIIADINNQVSLVAVRKLIKSIQNTESALAYIIMQATTPETLDYDLDQFGMDRSFWSYPKKGETTVDFASGLRLTGYAAQDQNKVIACAVSHMRAWAILDLFRSDVGEGGVVLEHDALFVKKLTNQTATSLRRQDGVIGLNSPMNATRRSSIYHQHVLDEASTNIRTYTDEDGTQRRIVQAPWVDDDRKVPQGIAGGSAYYIGLNAIQAAFENIKQYGIWPNDAMLCRQLARCYQVFPYLTQVQGTPSTTQG